MKKFQSILFFAVIGIATTASEVLAVLPEVPGEIGPKQQPAGWLSWTIATVLIVGLAIVSVKSSKRSHLD